MTHLHLASRLLAICAALGVAGTAHAEDSIWSAGVGKVLPSDELVSCAYSLSSNNQIYTVSAKLQKRSSDGTVVADPYTEATTKLKVKMQCYNVVTGVFSPTPVESATFADNATIACPANHAGVFIRCMLRSTDANPFTYGFGNFGGDPCGNGVSGITLPSGSNGYRGQITGYQSELNFRASAGNKLFNAAAMSSAQVHGTDLGYMFYAGGKLWAGYGDTWANTWMTPVFPSGTRGSILFSTNDLNPADSNGLSYSSWQGHPSFAAEIVPSCHNSFPPCSEVTAIATAGFGLREGSNARRIVWFASISNWTPFTSTATWAWSTNGGAFTRADKNPAPGTNPPVWTDASHFGAGAIWQDRFGGYIYIFGQRPYRNNTPIRLARVPATFASVMDRTQYEYWGGSGVGWKKDAQSPLAPSEGSYFGPAADIIPTSANAGPEFSVAYDAFANRWIVMLVKDRWTNTTAVELWQSSYITGPFTKVTSGATNLPNAVTAGGQWFPYNFFYGPYTSEHIMRNGGQSIYFQLSEWNGIPAFRPYNAGLWTFDITRNTTQNCVP